jgi:Txe/YoeB family toxin of Txe-Axe toxin-antitoxin module
MRDLKYHQDFKFRSSHLLRHGGLTCRNPWTFSTLFVKLSTKSGEVHWRCILQQERIIELLEQGVQVVDCEAHGFILSNGMTLI